MGLHSKLTYASDIIARSLHKLKAYRQSQGVVHATFGTALKQQGLWSWHPNCIRGAGFVLSLQMPSRFSHLPSRLVHV